MENKYIHNLYNQPITVRARDESKAILFTKVLQPERIDATTGRMVHSGYTPVTEEELKKLTDTSRTFSHYSGKLKLLVVCDELPPEAKTAHEALADARKAQGRSRRAPGRE